MASKRGPSAGQCMANWAWRPKREDVMAHIRGEIKSQAGYSKAQILRLLKSLDAEARREILGNFNINV